MQGRLMLLILGAETYTERTMPDISVDDSAY